MLPFILYFFLVNVTTEYPNFLNISDSLTHESNGHSLQPAVDSGHITTYSLIYGGFSEGVKSIPKFNSLKSKPNISVAVFCNSCVFGGMGFKFRLSHLLVSSFLNHPIL